MPVPSPVVHSPQALEQHAQDSAKPEEDASPDAGLNTPVGRGGERCIGYRASVGLGNGAGRRLCSIGSPLRQMGTQLRWCLLTRLEGIEDGLQDRVDGLFAVIDSPLL